MGRQKLDEIAHKQAVNLSQEVYNRLNLGEHIEDILNSHTDRELVKLATLHKLYYCYSKGARVQALKAVYQPSGGSL